MTSFVLIPKSQPRSKPQLMPKPSPLPPMPAMEKQHEQWRPLSRPSAQTTALNPNRGFNRYDPRPQNTADPRFRAAERTREMVEAERALRQQELQELANARSVMELEEEKSRRRQAELREERARELQELAQHMRNAPREHAAEINKVTGQERVEAERQMRQQELEVMTQARTHAGLEEDESNNRQDELRAERARELQELTHQMKMAPMESAGDFTKIAGQERIEAERQMRKQEMEEMTRARALAEVDEDPVMRAQAKLREDRARELHELSRQMRSGMTERAADINRVAGQERVEAERQMRQQELEAMTKARAQADLDEEESNRKQLQLKEARARELHELSKQMHAPSREDGIDKMTGQERVEMERQMRKQELEAMTKARANAEYEEPGDSAKRAQQLREERYRELQEMTQLMKLDGTTGNDANNNANESGRMTGQDRVLSERQMRQRELEEVARCRAEQVSAEEPISKESDPRQERMKELQSISAQLKGSLGLRSASQIESDLKTMGQEQREQEQEARRLELQEVARARAEREDDSYCEADRRQALIREERQRELKNIREGNAQIDLPSEQTAAEEGVENERQRRIEELRQLTGSRVQVSWERTTVSNSDGQVVKEKQSRSAVFV